MTVTYLVAIDIPDISQLALVAEEVHDALEAKGLLVDSVKPWARPNDPGAQPAGGFQSLISQPPIL